MLNFTSAGSGVTPALSPYGTLPSPYTPGPAFTGTTFDGATLLGLASSTVYRDGRCAAALRAGSLTSSSLLGVYGPSTLQYTIGNYDPTVAQYYITCYQTPTCGIVDIGSPIRVHNYNPSDVTVSLTAPRRGQLLTVTFTRDESGELLTPGADRAVKQAGLTSCWGLSSTDGTVVSGSTSSTYFETIFYAQPPAQAATTSTRSCYHPTGSSWTEVPNGVADVLAANPASFSTTPTTARQEQQNYLQFHGTGLGAGDLAKIIPLSANCSDASTPPVEIVAYDASGNVLTNANTGWSVNVNGATTGLNFSSTVTGTYSVCYRLATDTVWTLVYDNLTVAERNPVDVVQTPVSTLEGELFTLNFTASTSGVSSLSANDRVALVQGENANCMNIRNLDLILTSPSRTDLLPNFIAFQLDQGTRGNYTICYMLSVGENRFSPVWGFDVVRVSPNPISIKVFPSATTLYVGQLNTLVFGGWGLHDEDLVKLIPSTSPKTDSACRTTVSASEVFLYPLVGNGTFAVQTWRSAAAGSYWICYKLRGGQYHVMTDEAALTVTASSTIPTGATTTKPDTVLDGSVVDWTLVGDTGCATGDILFYSEKECNDVPYYATVESVDDLPAGATRVNCSLLTSPVYVLVNATTAPTTLSLCYYRAGTPSSVSILQNNNINVVAGTPPMLQGTISAVAQQIFYFQLGVNPAATDYLVLVRNTADCRGATAPNDVAVFLTSVYNSAAAVLDVTTAVPGAGDFYICYSRAAEQCADGDCARVVGRIESTNANPQSWTIDPSSLYLSTPAQVTFYFPTSGASTSQASAAVFMVHLTNNVSSDTITMTQVAEACLSVVSGASTAPVNLTFNSGTGKWAMPGAAVVGRYALCYNSVPSSVEHLTIFTPLQSVGPIVYGSLIDSVTFPAVPSVASLSSVILVGGGLSQNDQLVAVGVTGSTVPSDVCTNTAYSPRVTAEASTAGSGLSTIVRSFRFSSTGNYVLCYLSTLAPAGTDMELITPAPFTVMPNIVSVSVQNSIATVGVAATLEFSGSGMSASDTVAVVSVANIANPTVASVCGSATFSAMTTAAADGTSATYTFTPAVAGRHMICYRQSGGTDTLLLPNYITVNARTATAAVFYVQPSGCQTNLKCTQQPSVRLLNDAGEPTSSPYATLVLTLIHSNGTAAAEGLLSGGMTYTTTDSVTFEFLDQRVTLAGTYQVLATVTIPGSDTLTVRSSAFTVTDSASQVSDVATLACAPTGVLTGPTTVACTVTGVNALAPSSYSVVVTGGTSTTCDPPATPGSVPTCTFSVTVPASVTGDKLVNLVSVSVVPASPYEGWPVANSPLNIWVSTFPETTTSITCVSQNSNGLPDGSFVRAYDSLYCTVQGRALVDGVLANIVAPPSTLDITSTYNGDVATRAEVSPGETPATSSGLYVFTIEVWEARTLSVAGQVPSSRTSLTTWVPMTNSPINFTVLSTPSAASSTMTCATQGGSKLYFSPGSALTCTMTFMGSTGESINTLANDLTITMPEGGSATPPATNSYGSTLSFTAHSPAQPAAAPALRRATPLASTYDWLFHVDVVYTPSDLQIFSFAGTLVYVTSFSATTFDSGATVTLQMIGSGLDTTHRYIISTTGSSCTGVSATPSAGTAVGSLDLRFTVPNVNTFVVCYAPADAPDTPVLLNAQTFTVKGASGGDGAKESTSGWTTEDLVLLIVGVVFLFILLVLLAVLIWCLCITKRRRNKHTEQHVNTTTTTTNVTYNGIPSPTASGGVQNSSAEVFMPPRANDRFVAPNRDPSVSPVFNFSQPRDSSNSTPRYDTTQLRVNIDDHTRRGRNSPEGAYANLPPLPPLPDYVKRQQTPPTGLMSPLPPATNTHAYMDPTDTDSIDSYSTRSESERQHHKKKPQQRAPASQTTTMPPPPPPPGQAAVSKRKRRSNNYDYADIDSPSPPKPPRPADQTGLVATPRADFVGSLPRVPVSGPYEHLHTSSVENSPAKQSAPNILNTSPGESAGTSSTTMTSDVSGRGRRTASGAKRNSGNNSTIPGITPMSNVGVNLFPSNNNTNSNNNDNPPLMAVNSYSLPPPPAPPGAEDNNFNSSGSTRLIDSYSNNNNNPTNSGTTRVVGHTSKPMVRKGSNTR
ncbi:hypothetical protein AGDE_02722 [Angomonas deanei]|uniref:Uncharacterized protein n=1 Tax=Angomonas deanei TaxID=59799 RepID=A0A7G2CUH4_9TRYP|nr:hypothetical protein AGDE_02722 [Angomonas deanei]CAD2222949.1 hypothetical protein, conserved [Angomonas deanei]|eukprot:EPY41203.1 hypothetical protein AGDE_02722 [Angomonas deanei]